MYIFVHLHVLVLDRKAAEKREARIFNSLEEEEEHECKL